MVHSPEEGLDPAGLGWEVLGGFQEEVTLS